MKPLNEQTYYEILEIEMNAPPHEIHKAYEKVKLTYSGQNEALYSIFTSEEAGELLKLVEEAYAVLGNAKLRSSYDEKINSKSNNTTLTTNLDEHLPNKPNPPLKISTELNSQTSHPVTGRTLHGPYKIDHDFEHVIATRENFDGPFLKKIREYKQINLEQISQATRISPYYLKAIEENDFIQLPAPVYVRGFIVQYAKALKLNPEIITKSFMKIFKDSIGK